MLLTLETVLTVSMLASTAIAVWALFSTTPFQRNQWQPNTKP